MFAPGYTSGASINNRPVGAATPDYLVSLIVCWFVLGLNTNNQQDVPMDLGTVVAVSAGGYHTCAMRSDGQLDSVVLWIQLLRAM